MSPRRLKLKTKQRRKMDRYLDKRRVTQLPNMVIIASAQFGYHIDTYYYCKYLRGKYNLTYIGWDHGLRPIRMGGVNIIAVSRRGGVLRILRMLRVIWHETKDNKTIVFIKYIKYLSVAIRGLRFKNPMILDIRTGSVADRRLKRKVDDEILKCEAKAFRNITIISDGLARKLSLSGNSTILPLGADVISSKDKKLNCLRLLYVGTLHNRNIENVIDGVWLYCHRYAGKRGNVSLTIVGDGVGAEKDMLEARVEKLSLQDVVNLVGRVPHNQLKIYFDTHTVGVSYIPLTDFYDVQPPTKTFEYLMSGMPVLATNTSENARVINHSNGVLVGDSVEDICKGIDGIENRLETYSSSEIREKALKYNWEVIVNGLEMYLEKIT